MHLIAATDARATTLAMVSFQNSIYSYSGNPTAFGSLTLDNGTLEGGADFFGQTAIWVGMQSNTGYGVEGRASLEDSLEFSVSGGGSAQVMIHMAGVWHYTQVGQGNFGYTPPSYQVSLAWGSNFQQAYSGTNPEFSPTSGPLSAYGAFEMNGTYHFDVPWTVQDAISYGFYAGVYAQAMEGDFVYINDPITLELPDGVSLSSSSGSQYTAAIPEPSSTALLLAGLCGLFLLWRNRR